MNAGSSTIKRVLEIVVAVLLASIAFRIIGPVLVFTIRLLVSLVVFGGVAALLDWLLFRRNRITE